MLQNNPVTEFKKLKIKTLIIEGAPAIGNDSNRDPNFTTVNEKSYYSPVVRIRNATKIIYSSFKKLEFIKKEVKNPKKSNFQKMIVLNLT